MRTRVRTTLISTVALAALALGATSASAYSLDADGVGFVGKGEVQSAFGWNNKAAQTNAGAVGFVLSTTDSYDVTCEWTTGPESNRTVHTTTQSRSQAVRSDVAYDLKKTGQYTGYFLAGHAGDPVVVGALPAVGDPCPGNPGNGKEVVDVELVATTGGLYATFGGTSVLLP